MMASAAARHPPAEPCSASEPRTLVIFCAGKGSPMTPVEARNTSCALQPTTAAADTATSRAPSKPALPVKALALPLLTTSALASPPLRPVRHHSTGAEDVLDLVNTPATWVPGAMTAIRTSVRSWWRTPAAAVASRTPAKGGKAAKLFGARGEPGWPASAFLGAGFALDAPARRAVLAAAPRPFAMSWNSTGCPPSASARIRPEPLELTRGWPVLISPARVRGICSGVNLTRLPGRRSARYNPAFRPLYEDVHVSSPCATILRLLQRAQAAAPFPQGRGDQRPRTEIPGNERRRAARDDAGIPRTPRQGRNAGRAPARSLRGGSRSRQAHARPAPFRRAACGRNGAARRPHRRNEDRRRQDPRRHSARLSERAYRQGRACRHRERLS